MTEVVSWQQRTVCESQRPHYKPHQPYICNIPVVDDDLATLLNNLTIAEITLKQSLNLRNSYGTNKLEFLKMDRKQSADKFTLFQDSSGSSTL